MSIPDRLYLQISGDDGNPHVVGERTHCEDLINDDDVAYIRAGKVKYLLKAAIEALNHASHHYLSSSASAEVWSSCNGYEGAPDIVEELAALEA